MTHPVCHARRYKDAIVGGGGDLHACRGKGWSFSWSAWDRVLIAAIVIVGGVVAPLGVVSWRAALGNRPARFAPILPELAPKPIVVADPLAFLELQHYAPAELRPRVVYLADLPTALAVTGTDSADLSLVGLSKRGVPLEVVSPDQIKFNQAWLLGSPDSTAAQSLRSRGFQLRSTANVGVLDATRTFSQIH